MSERWRLAADIGGTFTDLTAWDESSNQMIRTKVLTVPDRPVEGVMAAVEKAGVPLNATSIFLHGSTVAINAVLQEAGARTALLTTRGFRDVLEMGRKNRPDMYNLFFKAPQCPIPREDRFEVNERVSATGAVIEELDDQQLREIVARLPPELEAVAICFINSYANPNHERRAAQVVRALRPHVYTTASTELSRESREYERTCTAVTNAYVGPVVSTYVGELAQYLRDGRCPAPLLITQSNGGVMTSEVAVRQPVRSIESGPAAGVTGAAWLGAALGIKDLIAFDMGGTSAKACVVQHGQPEVAAEYRIGGRASGLPVQVPCLDIVEVGAGGGSVAHLDRAGALRVGPRSAGSVPGPASYGRGGTEPTITDANLVLGRIDADYFLGGEMPLSFDLAESAVGKLGAGLDMQLDSCARGILDVANAIMAGAIRAVTVERGRDPRDFTLVAYGGAGPLHATDLARELGIPRVLIPRGPGTYGAFGMLVTDIRHDVARTVHARLKDLGAADLTSPFSALEDEASAYVATQLAAGVSGRPMFTRRLDLRYVGQFHPLTLSLPDRNVDPAGIAPLFHSAHLERYGHNAQDEPIEVTALRVTALLELPKPDIQIAREGDGRPEASVGRRRAMLDRSWQSCAVYRRSDLSQAQTIAGPAVVEDTDTNIVIGLTDRAEVMSGGHILVTVGGAA